MEHQPHDDAGDGQASSKDPDAPESEPATNPDPPRKFDPKYERLVAELFAQYKPQTAVEDAAVVAMAVALWKKRSRDAKIANDPALDEKIATALAQLSKSEIARCRHGTGTAASRSKSRPRSAAPRAPQRQRQASPQAALEFWTPADEGLQPEVPTIKEDPLAAIQRDFEEARRRTEAERRENEEKRERAQRLSESERQELEAYRRANRSPRRDIDNGDDER